MVDYEGFKSDYVTESGTSLGTTDKKPDKAYAKEEMKIDVSQYGVSKPKRVVLRARISDDKGL